MRCARKDAAFGGRARQRRWDRRPTRSHRAGNRGSRQKRPKPVLKNSAGVRGAPAAHGRSRRRWLARLPRSPMCAAAGGRCAPVGMKLRVCRDRAGRGGGRDVTSSLCTRLAVTAGCCPSQHEPPWKVHADRTASASSGEAASGREDILDATEVNSGKLQNLTPPKSISSFVKSRVNHVTADRKAREGRELSLAKGLVTPVAPGGAVRPLGRSEHGGT